MKKKKLVIVYGNSLAMAGVAASLKAEENLNIISTKENISEHLQNQNRHEPTVIIFDLADPPSELALGLLRGRPDRQLIGVDLSCDEILVLSGQLTRVLSGNELAGIVRNIEIPANDKASINRLEEGGAIDFDQSDETGDG